VTPLELLNKGEREDGWHEKNPKNISYIFLPCLRTFGCSDFNSIVLPLQPV
jgi:hypothetical protein